MMEVIIWFWALLCPNPHHTAQNHGKCKLMHIQTASYDVGDTGGETGSLPPKPPTPPPPPPGSGG